MIPLSMPEKEISARGGAVRWRTVKLPNGKYIHVAVVKRRGKRGGKTVAGRLHTRKAK